MGTTLTGRRWPAVVVGAGPAGLVTAISLARQGVEVLVVERRAGRPTLPRATVLSLRTVEMLRSWHLDEVVRAGGDDVDLALLETPTMAQAYAGRRFDVGLPTVAQSSVVSPTAPACVPQDHLETVLLDHLGMLPAATIVRDHEVVSVADDGTEAPTITLRDLHSGDLVTAVAGYVVGADGANSAVRQSLGIDMVGPDRVMDGVRVEFRAPLWDVVGDQRYVVYTVTDPDGSGVLVPAGGDRWVFGMQIDGLDDPAAATTRDALHRRVVAAIGVGLDIRIERLGHYSAGAQLADRFSAGRTFLVGDAAHRVTPRGGTGLNTAIGDGLNLGWKLAWVLQDWAPESLLATYEAERRGIAAHNVARSADPLGSRREPLSEMQVDLGGRIAHAWLDPGQGGGPRRSTLDVLGPGLTLLTAGDPEPWRASAGSLAIPMDVATVGPGAGRAIGVNPAGGALLVRPDGVPIAGWWTPGSAGDLRATTDAFLTAPVSTDHRIAA